MNKLESYVWVPEIELIPFPDLLDVLDAETRHQQQQHSQSNGQDSHDGAEGSRQQVWLLDLPDMLYNFTVFWGAKLICLDPIGILTRLLADTVSPKNNFFKRPRHKRYE